MGLYQHALLPLVGLAGLVLPGVDAAAPLRDLCPVTCLEAGPDPSNWTVVAEFNQLKACQRPLVLDFSVKVPVSTKQHIRVCNMFINDFDSPVSSHLELASTTAETESKEVVPQLAWTPAASEDEIGGRLVVQSVGHLKSYLANNQQQSKRIMLFGTVSDTTVGVYVGANMLGTSVAEDLFESFINNVYSTGIADSKASLVQVCDDRTGDDVFGLIAASTADFSTVHHAVGQWSNGTCVDTSSYAETRDLNATSVAFVKPDIPPTPSNGTGFSNATAIGGRWRRATECRTIVVDDNDGCGKLVTRCGGGLTSADFYKYNPAKDLCSTLQPGQHVCCTEGDLPDLRPKQNSDGSCFAYQIKGGDTCKKLAITNGLTIEDLDEFNKDTWGTQCLSSLTLPPTCLPKPFHMPISQRLTRLFVRMEHMRQ